MGLSRTSGPSAYEVLFPTPSRLRPHQQLERHAAPIPIGQQILTGGQSEQPFGVSFLKFLDRFRVRHATARDGLRDGEQIARTMIDLRHEVPDVALASFCSSMSVVVPYHLTTAP